MIRLIDAVMVLKIALYKFFLASRRGDKVLCVRHEPQRFGVLLCTVVLAIIRSAAKRVKRAQNSKKMTAIGAIAVDGVGGMWVRGWEGARRRPLCPFWRAFSEGTFLGKKDHGCSWHLSAVFSSILSRFSFLARQE